MAEQTDAELIESGKRAARQGHQCESVVIADANIGGRVQRAYFVCTVRQGVKHSVHQVPNGDEWWQDSNSGRWMHSGDELSEINWTGAGA